VTALKLRVQIDLLRIQHVQSQLGVPHAPHPDAEETLCVVCFDAPKRYAMLPCLHVCACEACAVCLKQTEFPACPICREPIERVGQVFT
jgi:hypothetical protein